MIALEPPAVTTMPGHVARDDGSSSRPSVARNLATSGAIGWDPRSPIHAKFGEQRVETLAPLRCTRGLSRRTVAERRHPRVEPTLPVPLVLLSQERLYLRFLLQTVVLDIGEPITRRLRPLVEELLDRFGSPGYEHRVSHQAFADLALNPACPASGVHLDFQSVTVDDERAERRVVPFRCSLLPFLLQGNVTDRRFPRSSTSASDNRSTASSVAARASDLSRSNAADGLHSRR